MNYDKQNRKIFSRTTVPQTGVKKRYELITNNKVEFYAYAGAKAQMITKHPKNMNLKSVEEFEDKGGIFRTHVYIPRNKQLTEQQIEINDFFQRTPKGEIKPDDYSFKIKFKDGVLSDPDYILIAYLDDHPQNEANAHKYGMTPLFREISLNKAVDVRSIYATRKQARKMVDEYQTQQPFDKWKALLYDIATNNPHLKAISDQDSINKLDEGMADVIFENVIQENASAVINAINAMRGSKDARNVQLWLQGALRANTIEGKKGVGLSIVWSKRVISSITDDRINSDPIYKSPESTDAFYDSLQSRGGTIELIDWLKEGDKMANGVASYVALYDYMRRKDVDGMVQQDLIERVNTFNSNFGLSNPHPDEKDNAKRFDSKILPILEKLENVMKYGN